MAITLNGITTGLLGYNLRKEMLGEGLAYRETEVYDYEIFATPSSMTGASGYFDIETHIRGYFSNMSGDINVKVLESPANYTLPNDHLRVGKFNVQVEVRRAISYLTGANPELTGNYYKGLDLDFFNSYSTIINNFSEEFSLEAEENGTKLFSHNLSFGLQSGNKATAAQIASGVFSKDKDNTFGINSYVGMEISNTGTHVNYYTETYDLIRNVFSFNKKREVLPASGSTYTYNLNHSLDFKQDGIIDVTERANIQGRLTFEQAKDGYNTLYSSSYTRCNSVYNTYKDFLARESVDDTLISFPMSSSKTFNKPVMSVDYDVTYTNNPNIIAANSGSLEKILDIEINENKYVTINHTHNFLFLRNPTFSNLDALYIDQLIDARTTSPIEVDDFYTSSVFYNPSRPTMNMIKMTASTPNRRKNFSTSFSYTNNPIYFVTIDGVTYKMLEYKINNNIPSDILNEYKIINRPNKRSIINYAYQTEKGTKNISLTAKIERVGNVITSPRSDLGTNIQSLYLHCIRKLMEDFVGFQVFALTYYLSDINYKITSENDLEINLTITYAIKKRKA